jgi:pyridoxine kinase
MKKILLVNDVVGYGRVGMAAMMPVLTYLGHPVYLLPTALVSNTLDYGHFAVQETTDYMRRLLPVWQQLGFSFDAICTGLMFSVGQARLVAAYAREQSARGVKVFVDPVLGDQGRMYNGISDETVSLEREMIATAHLIFPNYTEACLLTRRDYGSGQLATETEARDLAAELHGMGARSVLITSARVAGRPAVVGYNDDRQEYFIEYYEELPAAFHGTGDIFSAVTIGHLMNGETLRRSTRCAMNSVERMIARYADEGADLKAGLPIEHCLDLL